MMKQLKIFSLLLALSLTSGCEACLEEGNKSTVEA
jgi:hypothetical protein